MGSVVILGDWGDVIALNQIPQIFRLSRVLVESLICEVDVAHSFSGKDTNLCIK